MARQPQEPGTRPRLLPPPKQCVTCRHFDGGAGEQIPGTPVRIGLCKRYPPSGPVLSATKIGPLLSFAVVRGDSLCAEFAVIEKAG